MKTFILILALPFVIIGFIIGTMIWWLKWGYDIAIVVWEMFERKYIL